MFRYVDNKIDILKLSNSAISPKYKSISNELIGALFRAIDIFLGIFSQHVATFSGVSYLVMRHAGTRPPTAIPNK